MPWSTEQDKALTALIEIIKPPSIMALPHWEALFPLHNDPGELGAGAALTQDIRGSENVIGYASHRWSKAGAKLAATELEVMAVLWAIKHYRSYLWGRKFVLFIKSSPVCVQTDGVRCRP